MSLNIKIRDIEGYETTIGDAKKLFFEHIRTTHLKFNAKYLYNDKTFSDYGIKDGYIISKCRSPRGGAGFGLYTIDVEKNNTRIIELDYNAPPYRNIDSGLSVQAICENDIFSKIK